MVHKYSTILFDVPTWLIDPECPSSPAASNLRTCSHRGTGRGSCSHANNLILSCQAEGHLRLVNSRGFSGTLPTSGRLEVYMNGRWGTVCDGGFSQVEANVACRQLGFRNALQYGTRFGFTSDFPPPILLTSVSCGGHESTLLSCSHNTTTQYCTHQQDIELVCAFIPSVVPSSTTEEPPESDPNGSRLVFGLLFGIFFGAGILFAIIVNGLIFYKKRETCLDNCRRSWKSPSTRTQRPRPTSRPRPTPRPRPTHYSSTNVCFCEAIFRAFFPRRNDPLPLVNTTLTRPPQNNDDLYPVHSNPLGTGFSFSSGAAAPTTRTPKRGPRRVAPPVPPTPHEKHKNSSEKAEGEEAGDSSSASGHPRPYNNPFFEHSAPAQQPHAVLPQGGEGVGLQEAPPPSYTEAMLCYPPRSK